ncbi:dTDP-4-dehydrorhamnose reductase [Microvirga sp. VF16]|uniref:dTDP-4-dehydrorhamnose reductase n=1 Tax=Microvirga sp. VF16 TaxID=2807101 RepID=UPI00193E9FD0|nr:dTDP-4-dehydrorhamnose reductase [Microvirga sp. VF16]QRM35585.1 dTDP-4-dehydrorhamnose reductase [Microvirga sp. VF16]
MILVFGVGGQLGRELETLASFYGWALTGRTRAQADISNWEQVQKALAEVRPRVVINAAAYTDVDRAEVEMWQAIRVNATGPEVLARACADAAIPLIHVSAHHVFNGSKDSVYTEADPVSPINLYGRSKVAGEAAIREALPQHVIVRTSWVYGIHGANFLKTVLRLAGERGTLKVVDDQWGCPTSARELAMALLAIVQRLEEGGTPYGTYHFAGQGITTRYRFAQHISAAQATFSGKHSPVLPVPTEAHPTKTRRPLNAALDSSLFAETFGYTARPWEVAVREVVEELCSHPAQAGIAPNPSHGNESHRFQTRAAGNPLWGKLPSAGACSGDATGFRPSPADRSAKTGEGYPHPSVWHKVPCEGVPDLNQSTVGETMPDTRSTQGAERANLRRLRRLRVWQNAKIIFQDQMIHCMVRDLSAEGAGIVVKKGGALPKDFDLYVAAPSLQVYPARLCWQNGDLAGVSFG